MRTSIIIAALILLLAGTASADEGATTGTFMNGRGWTKMTGPMRAVYVMGLTNGLRYGDVVCEKSSLAELYIAPATIEEVVKALDRLYEDPANVWIPVLNALGIYVRQLDGATAEEIANEVVGLREYAAKIRTAKR